MFGGRSPPPPVSTPLISGLTTPIPESPHPIYDASTIKNALHGSDSTPISRKRNRPNESPHNIDSSSMNILLSQISVLSDVIDITNKNIKTILSENKNISSELKEVKKYIVHTNQKVNLIIEENKSLKSELLIVKNQLNKSANKNELDSVNKNITQQINKIIQKTTYADAIKSSDPAVLIKPKDKSQTSSVTKSAIKQKFSPNKIGATQVRNAAHGSIIVECKDKQSQELLKSSAIAELGDKYEIKLPHQWNPRFKVINISDKFSEQTIIDNIKKQNNFVSVDAKFKIVKEFVSKTTPLFYSYVIETDPKNYEVILKNEKINIGWDRCKVFEHIFINRCFKCLGFNHKSNECTKMKACLKCAGNHELKECNSEVEICVNCKYAVENLKLTLNVNHCANSKDCVVLQRRIDSARKRILNDQ